MEIKKNIPNNTVTRKIVDLDKDTGNIYESINIIARRANQIAAELKTELNRKLSDFSSPTDTMEEKPRCSSRGRPGFRGTLWVASRVPSALSTSNS